MCAHAEGPQEIFWHAGIARRLKMGDVADPTSRNTPVNVCYTRPNLVALYISRMGVSMEVQKIWGRWAQGCRSGFQKPRFF